ncbi:MAG: hypothetical protein ACD_72C00242G0001 [uncultured bacterium]|nr:MAG: hypothetical protein ACD_72C00242G0001 [uncultured bacterium]
MMFLINKRQGTISDNISRIKLTNKTINVSCPKDWKDYANLTNILKSTISDIRKKFGISMGKKMKSNDPRKKTDIVDGNKWSYVLNVATIACKN